MKILISFQQTLFSLKFDTKWKLFCEKKYKLKNDNFIYKFLVKLLKVKLYLNIEKLVQNL